MAEAVPFPHSDILQLNESNSERFSAILKQIRAIDVKQVTGMQNVDLSMEYWDKLKDTKSLFKLFLDVIDTLVSANNEWNGMLLLQKEGKALNEEQIEFISLVVDEYKNYFCPSDDINDEKKRKIETDWIKLSEKISQYLAIKDAAVQSNDPMEKKKNCCQSVIEWFVGCINGKKNNDEKEEENVQSMDNYHSMDDAEDLKINTPLLSEVEVDDNDNNMPIAPSFDKLQSFFAYFMGNMKNFDAAYFGQLQLSVIQSIDSLKVLQKATKKDIDQISTFQNEYNQN